MSRTPAIYSMTIQRGATWEESFRYVEDDEVTPIDLTGFQGRMQVRTLSGRYGTTTATTLAFELSTANGRLEFYTPAGSTVLHCIRIVVPPADYAAALNPQNARKQKYAYGLEIFRPAAGPDPEYVIPLFEGKITVRGETVR